MKNKFNKKNFMRILDLVFGLFLFACAFTFFLLPNNLVLLEHYLSNNQYDDLLPSNKDALHNF